MDEFYYSMVIQWDAQARIFVATVPELPGCITHGKTYEEAARQGQDAMRSWIMAAREAGHPLPRPRFIILS